MVLATITGSIAPSPLSAQGPPNTNGGALRVFLECSGGRGGGCRQEEFRTEIDWVNWMRDRQDAQLHVIITSLGTGSGGQLYTFDFIGLEDIEGNDDQLTYSSLGTDVQDETVRGMTRVLGIGLARYSLLVGAAVPVDLVSIASDPLQERLVTAEEVEDPWDFWVFGVDFNTNMSGETSRTNRNFRGGLDASRTTPTWKLDFDANGNWRRNTIQLTDSTITDSRKDWNASVSAVYALADHWSLGLSGRISAATQTNQDLSVSAGPRLEYSFWPYAESPRRSLRLRYETGLRYFDYEELTWLDQTEETRPVHSAELSINQRQPWGRVSANAEASQYLHELSKYRVTSGGSISYRLVRGLNLNLNGRVSWIRDQLFLPKKDITDEEILLQRRRLQSNFDWRFGVGFSFQFGSIYNNVVNNRF
jgi:hypothetical protein